VGAVQRLATVVIIGLVALATVVVLYLADESNRITHEQSEQEEAAIERGRNNYLSLCLQCHGPAGQGLTADGEGGTGRIGFPIGGAEEWTNLNQLGIDADGQPWSNADFGSGVEGRANYIRNRIINGQVIGGQVRMPAFGEDKNGPLNDEQVEELIVFIQHNDWNETYNDAVAEYDGYPTAPPAATEAAEEGEVTPAPDTGGGTANAGPYDIDMLDTFKFSIESMTIPANTDVTVNVANAGAAVHSFVVEGQSVDSGQLPGGGTATVIINLPPGTYTYICDVPGHKELGMVGTLTVVDPAAAPADASGDMAAGAPAAESPAADAPPADAAASGGPIAVEMTDEFKFIGVPASIPASTDVQFDVVNVGAAAHSFVIEGQGIGTAQLSGGGAESLTVNLPPGSYTVICDVPGHKELGMVATLTVQ